MLLQVWIALFVAGCVTSIAAFGTKTASLYASLMNLFVWLVVAVGALELVVVSNGSEITLAAPAVAALATTNALISLPVAYLAATGQYGDDGSDGLDSARGQMDEDQRHPGIRRGDL